MNDRLISLDAFRGFTIAAMITVNYPGSWSHVYAPLLHAEWNGITPTDLIFPFFLFIVGVSIALAYTKRVQQKAPKPEIYKKVIIRSLKIFVVGLLLNFIHHFTLSELRIAGVLQRIAVVFLVCAILFLNTKWKTQAIVGGAILLVYCMVMTLIPTPGVGAVSLEPGVNIAAWVDSMFLPGKLWQKTWDPEGLLSTFPAIVTGITGMLAGTLILSDMEKNRKVVWLFALGFLATIAGQVWDWIFPINKNLWSSSYVLFTSGLASMTLAASIFFIDILGFRKGTKIGIIFGANAITVYVLAALFRFIFYGTKFGDLTLNNHFMEIFSPILGEPKLASLIYALLYISFNFIPIYILYRKKIFIKL